MGCKHIVSNSKEFGCTRCTSYTAEEPAGMTCCGQCEHKKVVQVSEFLPLDVASRMRDMGKRIGFDGDKFEQVDNWLKIMCRQGVLKGFCNSSQNFKYLPTEK